MHFAVRERQPDIKELFGFKDDPHYKVSEGGTRICFLDRCPNRWPMVDWCLVNDRPQLQGKRGSVFFFFWGGGGGDPMPEPLADD